MEFQGDNSQNSNFNGDAEMKTYE